MRRDKPSRPWHLYALGLVAVIVAVLAILEIGPPGSSARVSKETVTAEDGVVQSSVTGTGNVAAGADVDVNFKTSGTLQDVYVSAGQHVTQGQLLATLDPTSAELSLQQAQQSLTAAEDQLTEVENGTASGSSSQAQASSGSSTAASYSGGSGSAEFVSDTTRKPSSHKTSPSSGTVTTITTITTISPSGTHTTTHTTPSSTSQTASSSRGSGSGGSSGARSGSGSGSGSGGSGSGSGSTSGSGSGSTHTTTTATPSPSSIASAQASVYGAQASVNSAEQALANTKLYAPISGTIASLSSIVAGDSVSGGGSSNASSSSLSSSSSSGAGGGAGTTTAGGLGGSGSGSSSSSSGGSSSSSPFAEIVNTSSLTMTVAFSESDIAKIKVGQPATVTLDALPGVELAAHVAQISDVGTTSSGVVSYDATIDLDQTDSHVKPGMSASAAVITAQAQGVTVPNAAVTGSGSLGTVNLLQNGKTVSKQVVVGLRGNSRTQIVSGLSAGQQLVVTIALPSLSSSATSTSGSSGTLGGTGTLGGGGGGFVGGGGGGGFFRRALGGGG